MKIKEFYSPTCVPCKMIRRKLEALAKDYPEVIEVEFINGLENMDMCRGLGILGFPHIIVEDNEGKEVINEHGTLSTISKIQSTLV